MACHIYRRCCLSKPGDYPQSLASLPRTVSDRYSPDEAPGWIAKHSGTDHSRGLHVYPVEYLSSASFPGSLRGGNNQPNLSQFLPSSVLPVQTHTCRFRRCLSIEGLKDVEKLEDTGVEPVLVYCSRPPSASTTRSRSARGGVLRDPWHHASPGPRSSLTARSAFCAGNMKNERSWWGSHLHRQRCAFNRGTACPHRWQIRRMHSTLETRLGGDSARETRSILPFLTVLRELVPRSSPMRYVIRAAHFSTPSPPDTNLWCGTPSVPYRGGDMSKLFKTVILICTLTIVLVVNWLPGLYSTVFFI